MLLYYVDWPVQPIEAMHERESEAERQKRDKNYIPLERVDTKNPKANEISHLP
jgi:hypothetical protein